MTRLLMCLVAFLLLSLAACLPVRLSAGPTDQHRARHYRACVDTCVRWGHRDRCVGYGRCHPERFCVAYACR